MIGGGVFLNLFYFFGGDGTDRAGLGGGCIPRRWRPQPQRTRTDCTRQAAAQAVPDARQTTPRTDTHSQTLGTLHRSALDTRPPRGGDRTGGGCWMVGSVSDRARPNGQKIKTYKYVIMLRVQLDKNVNIRYNIGTT